MSALLLQVEPGVTTTSDAFMTTLVFSDIVQDTLQNGCWINAFITSLLSNTLSIINTFINAKVSIRCCIEGIHLTRVFRVSVWAFKTSSWAKAGAQIKHVARRLY